MVVVGALDTCLETCRGEILLKCCHQLIHGGPDPAPHPSPGHGSVEGALTNMMMNNMMSGGDQSFGQGFT